MRRNLRSFDSLQRAILAESLTLIVVQGTKKTHMSKATTFIVVKCGNTKTHHAANEIEKVMKSQGYAWFAKYGSKINFEKIDLADPSRNYVLCLSLFSENKYEIFSYQIEELGAKKAPLKGTYPTYYQENFQFINTWIKVSKYKGASPSVNDLIIKSSLNRLTETLKKSTSGHFICRLLRE